jgi:Glycosyltransferase like family 2
VPSERNLALPSVSVVIPTLGARPGLLVQGLEALLADPAATEAIIVIDGTSSDAEGVLRQYASDARVRVTNARADASGSRGEQTVRDQGVRLATSDVVLAIDDDVVAGPGLVGGHASWHASDGNRVVLGYMPVQPPPAGGRWRAGTRLYAESYERACARYSADPDSILLGLWGGNFSVRREHWLQAQALRRVTVGFPHTDMEFGLRLRQLGLEGRFDRGLRATHHLDRCVSRVAAEAQGSAAARGRLHAAYPELIPEPNQPVQNRYARWLVMSLIRFTRRPPAWRFALGFLVKLTRAAHDMSLTAVEYALTRLVRRLAYERALASHAKQPVADAR